MGFGNLCLGKKMKEVGSGREWQRQLISGDLVATKNLNVEVHVC